MSHEPSNAGTGEVRAALAINHRFTPMNTDQLTAEIAKGAEMNLEIRRSGVSPRRGVGERLNRNGVNVTSLLAVVIPERQLLLRREDFLLKAGQFIGLRYGRLLSLLKFVAEGVESEHGLIGPCSIASRLHGITGGFVAPLHLPSIKEDSTRKNTPSGKQSQYEDRGYPYRFLHGGRMP